MLNDVFNIIKIYLVKIIKKYLLKNTFWVFFNIKIYLIIINYYLSLIIINF